MRQLPTRRKDYLSGTSFVGLEGLARRLMLKDPPNDRFIASVLLFDEVVGLAHSGPEERSGVLWGKYLLEEVRAP